MSSPATRMRPGALDHVLVHHALVIAPLPLAASISRAADRPGRPTTAAGIAYRELAAVLTLSCPPSAAARPLPDNDRDRPQRHSGNRPMPNRPCPLSPDRVGRRHIGGDRIVLATSAPRPPRFREAGYYRNPVRRPSSAATPSRLLGSSASRGVGRVVAVSDPPHWRHQACACRPPRSAR